MMLVIYGALVLGAGWGYVAASAVGVWCGLQPLPRCEELWMLLPATVFFTGWLILRRAGGNE